MNLKTTYVTIIIGILCIPNIYSQYITVDDIYNGIDSRIKTFDKNSKPTVGTPYLFKDFTPAKISIIKEICLVNFDAYRDKMEIEKNGKIYYLPKNNFEYDIHFINTKITYHLFNYERKKETSPGFFQVLTNNKGIYLLKKENIRKLEAKKANNGYDKSRPITFKRTKDSYYTCFKNNEALKLPSKKKHFLGLFNKKNKEIATYMKQQKLSHKKEADLIKIFNYYASLN